MDNSLLATHKWPRELSKDGHLSAWIVIEREAWALLQQRGHLNCPSSLAEPDFHAAYAWMVDQMCTAGLRPPEKNQTPWWVWVRRDRGQLSPYLEDLQGVLDPIVLALQLPAAEVVLSNFDTWHDVLNEGYIQSSDEDGIEFESLSEPLEIDRRLKASWTEIFQLDRQHGVSVSPMDISIQGCIWTLRQEYVLGVVPNDQLPLIEQ